MKSLSLLAGGVFLLTDTALFSAPPPPTRTAPRQTTDAPRNVRVEVLMVAMPQAKLLPLLPDLRDPKKIDAAVAHLLDAVQRKEAILTGYPVVSTLDGQRSVSETIAEKRYPTSFERAQDPPPGGAPVPPPDGSQTVIDSPAPRPRANSKPGIAA